MKKLIAISVVFALVVGAAFAQPSVGGSLGSKIVLIQSDSQDDARLWGGIQFNNNHVNVSYTNSDGTAGGLVRLQAHSVPSWRGTIPFAFGWWKPIPQLRVQIGHNPDGDFGAAQITGWGFNAEAQDSAAIDQDSGDTGTNGWKAARRAGFYGGYSEFGATLSIYPMDGLTINLVLPFGNGRTDGTPNQYNSYSQTGVGDIYSKFHLNVVYNIPDIGAVRITFQGTGGLADNDDYPAKVSVGNIFASFYLTAVEGLNADIGVAYGLPYENADSVEGVNGQGLGIGLGVRFTSGDFGIKFRAGAQLARTSAAGGELVNQDTVIGVGILPYFNVAGMAIYLNAGFGMSIPDDSDADSVVDWFVNPYIRKSVSNFTLYAGLKIWSDGVPADDAIVRWAIPVGFNAYF